MEDSPQSSDLVAQTARLRAELVFDVDAYEDDEQTAR